MRFLLPVVTASALIVAAAPLAQASRIRRGPTAQKHKATKPAGPVHQRAIDDARATEIQTALVKAGYLNESSGHWDAASEAAMQKMQSDNGWQTKIIPDSRALIKLGLGPSSQASVPAMPGTAADADGSGSK